MIIRNLRGHSLLFFSGDIKMETDINTKYVPQAGDVLSWQWDQERILFVVTDNDSNNGLTGIAIRDNRPDIANNHVVAFSIDTGGLKLVIKAEDLFASLNEEIAAWDRKYKK